MRLKTPTQDNESGTILQVDASMTVGVLFFLTLSSFVILPQATGKFFIGLYTVVIIVPFLISAVIIILKSKYLRIAKIFTVAGFLILLVSLAGGLIYLSLSGGIGAIFKRGIGAIFTSTEEGCAKDPGKFNVTTHPWQCSEFSPGSLAEQCAIDPGSFEMTIHECSKFIPPSNTS